MCGIGLLMNYLHLDIVMLAFNGVLGGIVELNHAGIPLDSLGCCVVTRLGRVKKAEITSHRITIIVDALDCRSCRFKLWQECKLHSLFWLPPVFLCFQINWRLLLLEVIAVREVPVRPIVSVVPIRIHILEEQGCRQRS